MKPYQSDGKSKSLAWQRPRTRGSAYILEDNAAWSNEERAEKIAAMRAFAEANVEVGGHFIIFEHLDGTQERLDRNP